jgi:hypothetical protein
MAIRDRVVVRTKDGSVVGTTIARQGQGIDISWPSKAQPWLVVTVVDKNGNPTGEEIRVSEDQVAYVSRDAEPKPRPSKRA